MKKALAALAIALFLAAPVSGDGIIFDDFEDGDVSDWQDGGDTADSLSAYSGTYVHEGNYALQYDYAGSNDRWTNYKEVSNTQPSKITVWFLSREVCDNQGIIGIGANDNEADNEQLGHIRIGSGDACRIDWQTSTSYTLITNPSTTNYYRFVMSNIDWSGETYDVALYDDQGNLLNSHTNIGFRYSEPGFGRISVGADSGQAYDIFLDLIYTEDAGISSAPTFNSESSSPSTWNYSDSVDVSANVTDDGTVSSVTATVFENGSEIKSDVALSDGDGDNVWNVSDLFTVDEVGVYYNVTLNATDDSGSSSTTELSQFVENSAPSINSYSTTPSTWSTGDSPGFTVNASDLEGNVSAVNLTVTENGSTIVQDLSLTQDPNGNWTVSDAFSIDQIDVWYNATIEAVDQDGGVTSKSENQYVTDSLGPRWRNLQDNSSVGSIAIGNSLNISVEWRDDGSGVARSILAINETGSWKNASVKVRKIVDDVEDGDLTEYNSSGATVSTSDILFGAYSAKLSSGDYALSYPGDGLGDYPSRGDDIQFSTYITRGSGSFSSNGNLEFGWAVQEGTVNNSGASFDGYSLVIDSDGFKLEENGSILDSKSSSATYTNETLNISINWGDAGGITVSISYLNGTLLQNGTLTATSTSFESGGVIFREASSDFAEPSYFDQYVLNISQTDYDEFANVSGAWVNSDFAWQNSTFTGILGYRFWGRDAEGNWNLTDTGSVVVSEGPSFSNLFPGNASDHGGTDTGLNATVSDPQSSTLDVYFEGLNNSVALDWQGRWHFDSGSGDTLQDVSGSNNDGSRGNGSAFTKPAWVAGINGTALEYRGKEFSTIPSASYFLPRNGSSVENPQAAGGMTVGFWANFNSYQATSSSGNFTRILGVDTSYNSDYWAFWLDSGKPAFYAEEYGGDNTADCSIFITSNETVALNEWHYISAEIVDLDGNDKLSLIVNGEVVAESSSCDFGDFNSDKPVRISSLRGEDYWLNGTVDELTAYDQAQDISVVHSLMMSGSKVGASMDVLNGTGTGADWTGLGDETYYWKVFADNGNVVSSSSIQQFTMHNPPEWRNLLDNASGSVVSGEPVNFSAEFRDELDGVKKSVLATNASNTWINYTTWKYTDTSISVSNENPDPLAVFQGEDGYWWVLGHDGVPGDNDSVYKYYSNWTFTGQSYWLGSEDAIPMNIHQDCNGDWWMIGRDTDKVYKYNSTWNYTGTSFSVSSQDTTPESIYLDGCGGNWWMSGTSSGKAYEYSNSWGYSGTSIDLTSEDSIPASIYRGENGYWWMVGRGTDRVYKYNSTWGYTGVNYSVSSFDDNPEDIFQDETGNWWLSGSHLSAKIYKFTGNTFGSPVYLDSASSNWQLSGFVWENNSFSGTLGYRVWAEGGFGNWIKTSIGTVEVIPPNSPPVFSSQKLIWTGIGGSESRSLNYSLSDPDGNDIASRNNPPTGTVASFSNSTYRITGFGNSFDYLAEITDFSGVSASIESNYSLTNSGVRSDDYQNTPAVQRVNRTVTVWNRGNSSQYKISMTGPGTVIQGTTWTGSVGRGQNITETGVWEGDWISNEANYSTRLGGGEILYGTGIKQNYTLLQNVFSENTRSDVNLSVDFTSWISDIEECVLSNSSAQVIESGSSRNMTFYKSCDPADEISHIPGTKTETANYYKYNESSKFEVATEYTSELVQEYAVPRDRLDGWGRRDPTKTEYFVDGKSNNLSLAERTINGTEYVVLTIGTDFGNSSLHNGTHRASLIYYESKSTGSTSGGAGGGVTTSSSQLEPVETVSGQYNWTVSAATSADSKSFRIVGYPGRADNKTIVLQNTGNRNVTLDIDCVSQQGFCQYVSTEVDRVKLDTGTFSETALDVGFHIPLNATPGDEFRFKIQVTDQSYNPENPSGGGVATVDFLITINRFFGAIIQNFQKLFEWEDRTLPAPHDEAEPIPISYPVALIPLLASLLAYGVMSGIEWALASRPHRVGKFILSVFVFIVVLPLV